MTTNRDVKSNLVPGGGFMTRRTPEARGWRTMILLACVCVAGACVAFVSVPFVSVAFGQADAASTLTVDQVATRLMDPCPDCKGKQLSQCDCPPAAEAKDEIRGMIAQGMTEDQILAAFVKKYGTWILATPEKRGFNLVAWALPFGLIAAGGGGLAWFLRRAVRPERALPDRAELSLVDRQRLEAELQRLDGEDRQRPEDNLRRIDGGDRRRLEDELRHLERGDRP